MPEKNDLKVEDTKVLWFNGEKWLIKESCSSPEAALTLLEELNNR